MEIQIIRKKFNHTIQKQINHLINEIEKSEWVDDKMIGCAAIILDWFVLSRQRWVFKFWI